MDLIIPNLYLGGIETASNAESLHSHLIAAVVCCCPFTEFLATEENPDFKYFRVDVEDQSREPIALYLVEFFRFICARCYC